MPKATRPIRIEGNIAYVPLTQGKTAVIDASDINLVEAFNWHAIRQGRSFYACRNSRIEEGKPRLISLHRTIMGHPVGIVDHRESSATLDCRRANLRITNDLGNCRNAKRRIDNKSGVKGVSWSPKLKKWRARIQAGDKKIIQLGYFYKLEDAAAAYCEASKRLHGEFGRTE